MMRALVFLGTLALGLGLLVWQAGGLSGPRTQLVEPVVDRQPAVQAGQPGGALAGPAGIDVRDVGGPRYALPSARVFRDPQSGESVEVPHFVPWTFEARTGHPGAADGAGSEGAVVFEDVVVRSFRAPTTLEEARRLRADPRSTDAFLRLELYAKSARADGIARYLESSPAPGGVRRDTTIRLDGDVVIHDLEHDVWMRGQRVTFDPEAGRAEGEGRFLLEHPAWTIEGDALALEKDARLPDVYRISVGRSVLLRLREELLDTRGRPLLALDPQGFRPARVLARRATVLSDEAGGHRLHVALEGDVRALQEGGRRLAADRLRLTVEQPAPVRGSPSRFTLADLVAEGDPLVIEVPDLEAQDGSVSEARITARRLRRESVPFGEPDLVLEGEPVIVLAGDLPLPGMPGEGAYVRASARDRAVLSTLPEVARDAHGAAVPGRRLALSGDARLMRRGLAAQPYEDVLLGDVITLRLKAAAPVAGRPAREQPVSFAAEGHVRLAGTRLEGETERIRAERLDTLEPVLDVEGAGTRLLLKGLAQGQRLLGREPDPAPSPAPSAGPASTGPAASAQSEWVLDRVEAVGGLAATTRLGGPSVGLPAWVEAESAAYDRLDGRALLRGAPGLPAWVRVEAGPGRAHLLRAPTLSFDVARTLVRAEGGASGEVWLSEEGPEGLPAGMGGDGRSPARLTALALQTDARIEVRFHLAQVGGEPALAEPQSVRVHGPFTAEMQAGEPGIVDRVRADRLDMQFARRLREPASQQTASVARPASAARAAEQPSATDAHPRAPRSAGQRWAITSRDLSVDLEAGRVGAFEAQGGVAIDGEELHCQGETLRFERAVGALLLDGGTRGATARFGAVSSESQVRARALRLLLSDAGPRWLLATGPTQALFVQRTAGPSGAAEQFEVDSRGDVRITPSELSAAAATWVRRRERAQGSAAWGPASEIWADRVTVSGRNLLSGGLSSPVGPTADGAGRVIERIVAEGPSTTFQSGEGSSRIQMWCDRILVDAGPGTATLTGRPGTDVRVQRQGQLDLELLSATFDFRTGQLRDLEAGSAVLRRRER